MAKPLFVLQPPCNQRLNCRECRSTSTEVYRKGWADRYQMPEGWPQCPYGYPMGYAGTSKPPIPIESLALAYARPGAAESQETMRKVSARADAVRPTCLSCPGGHMLGVSEDGLVVDCRVGYTCCTGGLKRGNVFLGSGNCLKGYWKD